MCYAFLWISGLVFLLVEKDNKFVRFHAWQSTVFYGVLFVAWVLLTIVPLLSFIVFLVGFALWFVLMYKAYKEEEWKIPLVGKFAENRVYGD